MEHLGQKMAQRNRGSNGGHLITHVTGGTVQRCCSITSVFSGSYPKSVTKPSDPWIVGTARQFTGITKAGDMKAWWERHRWQSWNRRGWIDEVFKHQEPMGEVLVDMSQLNPNRLIWR